MNPVILRRLAQAEFGDAVDWYEARRAGGGLAFEAAVNSVLNAIATAPDSYPVVEGDAREAIVAGYPYAVDYRILPARVDVFAVFHTSRDPAVWQSRVGP